ncbi:MAG: hypothetical protein MJZ24_02740 [Paludibacteraceae bacterium]|nr:hypothetical protein [Candidatus Physcocola equi]MCQ2233642.1 hypothetical protein [Paludibacteraceae bacterium]
MKKMSLIAGIVMLLAFFVSVLLVALKKYPAVDTTDLDSANQMSMLWLLVVSGVNFFMSGSRFKPEIDHVANAIRVMVVLSGVAAIGSYFSESLEVFADRSILLFSLGLLGMSFIFFLILRWADND